MTGPEIFEAGLRDSASEALAKDAASRREIRVEDAASTQEPCLRIWGTLRDAQGDPASGKVFLRIVQGDAQLKQLSTSADAHGAFEAKLPPVPLAFPFTPIKLEARAERGSSSSRKSEEEIFLPALAAAWQGEHRIDLRLRATHFVRGRVVSARGGAPYLAHCSLLQENIGKPLCSESSDAEGLFELPIPEGGGRYRLRIVRYGVGISFQENLVLSSREDRWLGDISLKENGVLQGEVVFPDGKPAPLVEVYAHLQRVAEDSMEDVLLSPEGMSFGTQSTNHLGQFRIAGLKSGLYTVRAETRWDASSDDFSFYTTDSGPIRLVIDAYAVRVAIRDENGKPIPSAQLDFKIWGPGSDLSNEADEYGPKRGEESLFFVNVGSHLELSASAPGTALATRRFFVDGSKRLENIALIVKPVRVLKEKLHFFFLSETGNPLSTFNVLLRYPGTSISPTESHSIKGGVGGAEFHVPPGQYDLYAETDLDDGFYFDLNLPSVTVAEGATTVIRKEGKAGGRIRIVFDFAPGSTALSEDALVSLALQMRGHKESAVTMQFYAGSDFRSHLSGLLYPGVYDASIRIGSEDPQDREIVVRSESVSELRVTIP